MRKPVFHKRRLPKYFFGKFKPMFRRETAYLLLMMVAAVMTLAKGLVYVMASGSAAYSASLASLLFFPVVAVTFRIAFKAEKDNSFYSPRFIRSLKNCIDSPYPL